MTHPVKALLAVFVALVGTCAWAHGDVSCDVAKSEWRPRVELQKKLKGEGWTIRDIRILNGCYEVYGFDARKARVEAFFNPKTFERVIPADALPATP